MSGREVLCDYCGGWAKLVTGKVIYPHRPDLFGKSFYQCAPCDAFVGCHPGTVNPLGRLADATLRKAKQAAHAAFDPLWKSGGMKRGAAYAWLADKLCIQNRHCHIGMMDPETCARVVAACATQDTP